MPAQYFDIREDEQLSIEIRKYACLFDKSNAGYKAKDRIENAWKEIDNSLGIEESITLFYDYFNFYFMIMTTDITDIFQFQNSTKIANNDLSMSVICYKIIILTHDYIS